MSRTKQYDGLKARNIKLENRFEVCSNNLKTAKLNSEAIQFTNQF